MSLNERIHLRRLVALAYIFPAACFADVSFVCPESAHLASGVVAADSIPEGFQGEVSKTVVRLSGINMFDGPPEQGAALVPHSETKRKGGAGEVSVWRFEGEYPDGKYISCDYGRGLFRIFSRVGDSIRSCAATTEYSKLYQTMAASFVCK